ncbi:MAG: peptidase [Xanthomonadaceae bacterium]|nr:peptidase [Xanthomonadaceae bacterium]
MHLSTPEPVPDTPQQRTADRRRLQRALNASLAAVLVLAVAFAAQHTFDWRPLAIAPHAWPGLIGIVTAPLLHGSPEHLGANAVALLLLGTLSGMVYPRATVRALPLLWLGSGLGAWMLGEAGTRHLGASGVAHGLMFLVFGLGLLRRDRPAIAAAMIAFFLYGGMLLTVLPHEAGVSWQAHFGGALAGLLGAWLFRRSDAMAPRKRYSWEEDDFPDSAADPLEPPRPDDVPVLWIRTETSPGPVVVRLPNRD